MMGRRYLFCLSVSLSTSLGCVSSSLPHLEAPGALFNMDKSLAGDWTDSRSTQFGPAWVRYSFGCDCTFRFRVQRAFSRIAERGRFQSDGQVITFTRPNNVTASWPYRVEGDQLYLTEAPGDVRQFKRSESRTCSP